MEPMSLMGLGSGIAGAATSAYLGQQAAELHRQSGLERARREALVYQQELGQGEAAAGASGLVYGPGAGTVTNQQRQSSMSLYLAGLSQEFRRRNDWNVKIANQGADLEALSADIGAVTDIGKSVFSYGRANNFWQPTPTVS